MKKLTKFRRTTTPKTFSGYLTLLVMRSVGVFTRRYNYRGVGRVAQTLGKFLTPAAATIQLSKGTVLEIDLFDAYWARLIFDDFIYEPEIEAFIAEFADRDFMWVDCGANIGYWSLRLSERLPPNHVIAVEASPITFTKLTTNNTLSGKRFQTINRALSDNIGEILPFVISGGHAAAHLMTADEENEKSGLITVGVETITIDEVLKTATVPLAKIPLFIKLDVEGAEIAALNGAKATIENYSPIIIYECHGSDLDCSVTQYLLRDGRFKLYSLELNESGTGPNLRKILSVGDARALKKNPRKGYNFVAIKKNSTLSLASSNNK